MTVSSRPSKSNCLAPLIAEPSDSESLRINGSGLVHALLLYAS